MKQIQLFIIVTLLGMLIPIDIISQSSSFKENLKKDIALFESAKTAGEFIYAANCFEKLAMTEKNQWLPFYYAGLCDVLAAFEKQNKEIDTYCDKAELFARKADSLSKNNSEVMVLKSMIAAARINVNKAQRGQKFGLMASKFAAEALKLDETNPRAHFVKGKAILNTPPTLGGGEKKAKPIFEIVIEKDKTFKALSNLHPSWGRAEAEQEIKKINLSTKK
ncbi:MAG TPA: hypothetical protein PKZ75_08330 [Bacteroidia bacterium]|nr:hypothetical protein [Bacteroidia bacterium]